MFENAPHSFITPISHLEQKSPTPSVAVQPKGHLVASEKSSLWQQDEKFLLASLSVLDSCSTSCSILSKDLELLMNNVLLFHQKHHLNLYSNALLGIVRDRSDAEGTNANLALPSLVDHQERAYGGATISSHTQGTPGKISPL